MLLIVVKSDGNPDRTAPVLCVVGAGTAGLEALLCARELLGSRVRLRLIAPDRVFRYRPTSAGSLYRPAEERALPIADLVADVGATWVQDRVAAVHDAERELVTRDGDTIGFDFLLLTLGAHGERALGQGYLWQRGADPSFLDQIIGDIVGGEVASVAVVVPRGAHWPVPAYELALVLGWTAAGTRARVTLITAERRPLGALGPEATDVVTRELDDAGVELISAVEAVDGAERDAEAVAIVPEPDADTDALLGRPRDPASLRLGPRTRRRFDRLISLPTTSGPFMPGVASDAAGFIEVDDHLRVCGSERIWAVGACVSAALEHGALAAAQADAAVAAIAAATGSSGPAGSPAVPGAPELTGMLLTDQRERWQAENPRGTRQPSTRCLWWPPGRAVGRMLARRIAAWDPSVVRALPTDPSGVMINVPVAVGCGERPSLLAGGEVTAEVRAARLRDIEHRQFMAVEHREQLASAEPRAMSAQLQTLSARQESVIRELQRHGYLRDRAS